MHECSHCKPQTVNKKKHFIKLFEWSSNENNYKKFNLTDLLLILNGFLTRVPIKLSSILHSHGENRETRNKTMLTPK